MENLKQGDVLEFRSSELEVLGVCGLIVFTREVVEGGTKPPEFNEISDLVAWGWKIKS